MFVVILIAGLLAALFFAQRSFFYPAPRNFPTVPPSGYRFAETATSDGLALRAAYRPPEQGRPTLVFFHGNGDSLAGADMATRQIVAAGYGAMLVEYRGYGGNPGSPSEEGLYRDGEAALKWLAGKGIRSTDIVIVGNSVGSGPATEMAARHDVRGLVLVSGFSSLPAVVRDLYPWLPISFLVRDKFDNAAKLHRVRSPVLILQGANDGLVRPVHAPLLEKAAGSARVIMVPETGHELAYTAVAQRHIVDWLASH